MTSHREALLLGVTQGVSEALPVSSSGHLVLLPWLLYGEQAPAPDRARQHAMATASHAGTALGTLLVLRGEVAALTRAGLGGQRLPWLLVASCLPAAAAGACWSTAVTTRLGRPEQVAALLAGFGALLGWVDNRAPQHTAWPALGPGQISAMAAAQVLALAPGVSRNGVTLTVGRATGLERPAAALVSTLMGVPVSIGAALHAVASGGSGGRPAGPLVTAAGAAALTGGMATRLALSRPPGRGWQAIGAYRVALGAAALVVHADRRRRTRRRTPLS